MPAPLDPLWLKIASPTLTFLGLLFTAYGILVGVARGRRELAANLLYNYAKDGDWATSRAIELAKRLPEEAINLIKDQKEISLDSSNYDAVTIVLPEKFTEDRLPSQTEGEQLFQITAEQSQFIRSLWLRWMIRLEGTLAAWLETAADAELLEKEFVPLVKSLQEQINRLSDKENFPIIHKFKSELVDKPEVYEKIIKREVRVRGRLWLGIFPSLR